MTQPSSQHIRFRGRSLPVLALEPEAPIADWIMRLDEYLSRFPVSFARKPIVIDASNVDLKRPDVVALVESLSQRGIRILGLSGVETSWASDDLPPILTSGRALAITEEPKCAASGGVDSVALAPNEQIAFDEIAERLGVGNDHPKGSMRNRSSELVAPLVIDAPVRSGQTILCEGDVTVIGSVASGADVIAGGSIHIYGMVRGRVMAGAYGDARARIFCQRLEAELLAVDGFYMTAEQIDAKLRRQAVQAWLEDDKIKMAKFD
jgi:septum site-determining protein MinC